MTIEDAKRYTMGVNEVRQRLGVSRQTVHDLTKTKVLSFVTKKRGTKDWKYFDPQEVDRYAAERGVETPEVPSGATQLS